ncbi:MAG: TrkH family potassium uptake protein [Mycoplasma sp.]|nr:TrkH family potassium uptake protein [Mycoplasma sp.]
MFQSKKNKKNKIYGISLLERFIFWFKNLSFTKHILFIYLLITFIGSGLLMLPFSKNTDVHINYIDALFISASAFSDTGLVTVNTTETWSIFGQTIIAILILVGGIGFFALKIFIFNILFGKPISFGSRIALSAERGNIKIGETKDLIKVSIITLLTIMTFAGFILSIYFYFSPSGFNEELANVNNNITGKKLNPTGNWNLSIRYGIFHSISAINNAGFDIMGSHSIAPYYKDFFIQFSFILLFIFGGIGYPVIYDIKRFFSAKRKGNLFKFSLFTKLSCSAYFIISILGITTTFIIEVNAKSQISNPSFWSTNFLYFDATNFTDPPIKSPITKNQKILALLFNTLSTRNAGFSTINFHSLNTATLLLHSMMMFLGSAPSSTAGGIRTTTFAIVCISFWNHITGKTTTRAFKRKINSETVKSSYIVTTISLIMILIATLVSLTSLNTNGGQIRHGANYNFTSSGEPQYGLGELLFETSSAFGTTGLSTGLTSLISTPTKITFILLMFIGQLGVSSAILAFGNKKQKSRHYKYIEEDIAIG